MKPLLKTILTITVTLLLTGCESLGYYYQALEGQLDLLQRRQPIDAVLINPDVPEDVKTKLRLVLDVRQYAEQQLQLPVDDHYSQYADLERRYVVWNVFAAPEFSIKPETWCYPIAGCVAYKGYFSEQAAQQYADTLAQQGFDVYVGGVAAYSTLGWFEDPVLSTFMRRSEAGLAGLLIHELAHQKLYVEDDSAFNESFATTVEIIGLDQWLASRGQEDERQQVKEYRQHKHQFVALVLNHRNELKALYEAAINDAEKRRKKKQLTAALRADYEALKQSWGGYSGYDRWFQGPLNNAQLSTIATYHHWVDSFMALYRHSQGDWARFYQRCQEIAELNRELRDETLEKLSMEAANFGLYSKE